MFMYGRGPYWELTIQYAEEHAKDDCWEQESTTSSKNLAKDSTAEVDDDKKTVESNLEVTTRAYADGKHAEVKDEEAGRTYSVDVLVPCYKEDFDQLAATVLACMQMRKPSYVSEVQVYLLDDGGRDERRVMCETLGAHYVCRPDRGTDAKAGNMNHALAMTTGELIMFLDADMEPTPNGLELLSKLLLQAPPEVAMVQSPQRYRDLQKCDIFGSRNHGFYDKIMIAFSGFGAVPFVGTGALFKRAPLMEVGGPPRGMVTEDVATSLELHLHGYKSIYYPHAISFGTSPQDISLLLGQRMRWMWGNLQTFHRRAGAIIRGENCPWATRMYWANCMLWTVAAPVLLILFLLLGFIVIFSQGIVPRAPLVRASFLYFLLVPLAHVLFLPEVSAENFWTIFTDGVINIYLYFPFHMVKCTYLMALYVIYGRHRHFASAAEVNGIKVEYLVVLIGLGVYSLFMCGSGLFGIVSLYTLGHETLYGQLVVSASVFLKGVQAIAFLTAAIFPVKPVKPTQKEERHKVSAAASRTRYLLLFLLPIAVEYVGMVLACLYSLGEYVGVHSQFN
jgi:cellulose synthase (UDP-forming)